MSDCLVVNQMTLVGKRLLPVICISSAWVTESFNAVVTLTRQGDQANREPADSAAGHLTSAMRSTNKNDAFYAWVALKISA